MNACPGGGVIWSSVHCSDQEGLYGYEAMRSVVGDAATIWWLWRKNDHTADPAKYPVSGKATIAVVDRHGRSAADWRLS
jgi:hypothetical protein